MTNNMGFSTNSSTIADYLQAKMMMKRDMPSTTTITVNVWNFKLIN